jgi:hypothetical protein
LQLKKTVGVNNLRRRRKQNVRKPTKQADNSKPTKQAKKIATRLQLKKCLQANNSKPLQSKKIYQKKPRNN